MIIKAAVLYDKKIREREREREIYVKINYNDYS